jgi:hypothetical protein
LLGLALLCLNDWTDAPGLAQSRQTLAARCRDRLSTGCHTSFLDYANRHEFQFTLNQYTFWAELEWEFGTGRFGISGGLNLKFPSLKS